jgi:hypothetical protein
LKDKNLWKELIRKHSVADKLTKAVLAQTCKGVFFTRSVSDKMFAILLISKKLASRRGPSVVRRQKFKKHCFKISNKAPNSLLVSY